jgi:hypothetical protein
LTFAVQCAAVLLAVPPARADESSEAASPATSATEWSTRYEAARRHLLDGDYEAAFEEFVDCADTATNESDKRLAYEMARVAAEGARRSKLDWKKVEPVTPPGERPRRTSDELTLLYTTSFLYGAGTGAWFLLQTQPDSALTATLPFIGIAAAPVIGVAIADGVHPLPHGVPHGLTVGAYVGLGEAIWIVGYQHSRADRLYGAAPDSPRWDATKTSSVLWGGATLGAIAGGVVTSGIPTTPGRVSFTGSTSIWGGVLTGMATSSLVKGGHRSEDALLATGVGYNLGLINGMLFARSVSPSVSRVRLIDLSGAAGGLVAGGLYLSFAGSDANSRAAFGLSSLGAATGLALGWIATSGMAKDEYGTAREQRPASGLTYNPTFVPLDRGIGLAVAGSM